MHKAPTQLGMVRPASELDTAAGGAGCLPVRPELEALLPRSSGLHRGSTVMVHGSLSLLCALLAEATVRGSWAAVVGVDDLGLIAAAEAGVEVDRLALIPEPGVDPARVIAAVLDGVDLVAVGASVRLSESQQRRLAARARDRRAVLLSLAPWPGAEIDLRITHARRKGLGCGYGLLHDREVTIEVSGRGTHARPRSHRLLLPSRTGAPAALPESTNSSQHNGGSVQRSATAG